MESPNFRRAEEGSQNSGPESPLFGAKPYLDRKVESLGLDDVDESVSARLAAAAQQKLQDRLERAETVRDSNLQIKKAASVERHRRIREARRALADDLEHHAAELRDRQSERQLHASRRRRISLENIKKARQQHNNRVARKRSESLSQDTIEVQEKTGAYESKLARAQRNRERLYQARRRRALQGFEVGRARAFGGAPMLRDEEAELDRQRERLEGLRKRHADSFSGFRRKSKLARTSDRRARHYAAAAIQAWYRCLCEGRRFSLEQLSLSSMDSTPVTTPLTSPRSLGADSSFSLSPDLLRREAFSSESDEHSAAWDVHRAARSIARFLKRHLHSIKVVRALLAARPHVSALCELSRAMEHGTFNDAMDALCSRPLHAHTEHCLKALRMGKEMRHVSAVERSARSFATSLAVHHFPVQSLEDDFGSHAEDWLKSERASLVHTAAHAVCALMEVEAAVDAAAAGSGTITADQFRWVRRAGASLARARLAFCLRFSQWKQMDAARIADQITATLCDVLLMQLRANKDAGAAQDRYYLSGVGEQERVEFLSGFQQVRDGSQSQLRRLMDALCRVVDKQEARRRLQYATEVACERHRSDEAESSQPGQGPDAKDPAPPEEGGQYADERMTLETYTPEVPGYPPNVYSGPLRKPRGPPSEKGRRKPLAAADLLCNEWLVHEIMLSETQVQITIEEALEHKLLHTTNAAKLTTEFWDELVGKLTAGQLQPLITLTEHLRDNIIDLTPRRKDLAAETTAALDVELLSQMLHHNALELNYVFGMLSFAGARVLELEAPIRNEDTQAQLLRWRAVQEEVVAGTRNVGPSVMRECFEYLLSKMDEIHLDILNAHLHFVTPYLKQNGVDYERDRFSEKITAQETSLDNTHTWLHCSVKRLRAQAAAAPAPTPQAPAFGGPPESLSAPAQLLMDLQRQQGAAYLTLLRNALVDQLLGGIVRVDKRLAGVAVDGEAEGLDEAGNPLFPETMIMDRYRLVTVAAGAEQVAYTATLLAFVRQTLAVQRVALSLADVEKMRRELMILFDSDNIMSQDIRAQIMEYARVFAKNAGKAVPEADLHVLGSRVLNVLLCGDCSVYQLYLRRVLGVVRAMLDEPAVVESTLAELALKASLKEYTPFLLQRVVQPLFIISRHNEAVYVPFYNELIPLALQTTDGSHEAIMNVD